MNTKKLVVIDHQESSVIVQNLCEEFDPTDGALEHYIERKYGEHVSYDLVDSAHASKEVPIERHPSGLLDIYVSGDDDE